MQINNETGDNENVVSINKLGKQIPIIMFDSGIMKVLINLASFDRTQQNIF